MTIWGNHSASQYPDLYHAQAGGRSVAEQVDQAWLRDTFIPTVAKRGAAIIDARGASSAASAANAAIDHMHSWVHGTPADDWVSAAVVSDGSYGVPEGLLCGFPVTSVERRLPHRAGPDHRPVLPGTDRRLGRRTGRGTRRRHRTRPDLTFTPERLPSDSIPLVARTQAAQIFPPAVHRHIRRTRR